MRWGECESRECSIGESGGEQIRDWVAPVSSTSFHSTGYPGDLKFPGRSDQYFSIFRLATDDNWIFLCGLTLFAGSRSYIISLGTREEVPPPCNFLMARGGGGEVKTRQAEPGGDGGVRGN